MNHHQHLIKEESLPLSKINRHMRREWPWVVDLAWLWVEDLNLDNQPLGWMIKELQKEESIKKISNLLRKQAQRSFKPECHTWVGELKQPNKRLMMLVYLPNFIMPKWKLKKKQMKMEYLKQLQEQKRRQESPQNKQHNTQKKVLIQ